MNICYNKGGSVLGEENEFNLGKRIKIRKKGKDMFRGDRKGTIMKRRQGRNYRRKEKVLGEKEAGRRAGGGGGGGGAFPPSAALTLVLPPCPRSGSRTGEPSGGSASVTSSWTCARAATCRSSAAWCSPTRTCTPLATTTTGLPRAWRQRRSPPRASPSSIQ